MIWKILTERWPQFYFSENVFWAITEGSLPEFKHCYVLFQFCMKIYMRKKTRVGSVCPEMWGSWEWDFVQIFESWEWKFRQGQRLASFFWFQRRVWASNPPPTAILFPKYIVRKAYVVRRLIGLVKMACWSRRCNNNIFSLRSLESSNCITVPETRILHLHSNIFQERFISPLIKLRKVYRNC